MNTICSPIEIFLVPLQWYSSWWADYNKAYPYQKQCTPTGKSVPLPENVSFYGENFHSLLEVLLVQVPSLSHEIVSYLMTHGHKYDVVSTSCTGSRQTSLPNQVVVATNHNIIATTILFNFLFMKGTRL